MFQTLVTLLPQPSKVSLYRLLNRGQSGKKKGPEDMSFKVALLLMLAMSRMSKPSILK